MKISKKALTYIVLATTLLGGVQSTFATVYGEVVTNGAVAYCGEQALTSSLEVYEQFKILDMQQGMDVYAIEKEDMPFYVNKECIKVRKVVETISVEDVKVRNSPEPDADIIARPSIGENVSVMYRSGNWLQVVLQDGREGFIYKTQLVDPYIELLEEKDFSKPKVEVIQWSEASSVIPRGAVVTVEDVKTGKTFKIKRTFGTNHADVEALTSQDTNTIKQIWGGFSWERRPVIIHVAGRRLAASLAGMPHAGDSLDAVKNNGMSGVIDLHFRGSRKHKEANISATVDPLHQEAISIAAKYE